DCLAILPSALLPGPFARSLERASSQLYHHRLLVVRRSAQIRARLRVLAGNLRGVVNGRGIQRLAPDQVFRLPCLDRSAANIGKSDPGPLTNAAVIQGYLHGDTHRSEVPDFTFEFKICAAATAWR